MYSLRFLGGVSFEGPSGPVSGRPAQRRELALLATLAAASRRGVTRDKLVGRLWPDCDEDTARRLLSNALYVLRREMGEESVRTAGDTLRLDPDIVWSDVAAFQGAIAAGDLEAAVAVYTGPFLDGFYADAGLAFETWLDAERTRLALLYTEALESLGERAEAAKDHGRAAGWWQRLVAQDPYNSRYALRLMRVLAAAGDPANAIRHAEQHTRLLERDLDIEPPPELLDFAEQLGQKLEWAGVAAGPPDARDEASRAQAAPPRVPVVAEEPASHPRLPNWRTVRTAIVGALATATVVVVLWQVVGVRQATTEGPSVAVLPFANPSGREADRYFADGYHEDVLNQLAKIASITVLAGQAVLKYRNTEKRPREIGRELRASAILHGSVRREGGRLRVTAQLVNTETEEQLWSGQYDEDISAASIFAIQSSIARQVAYSVGAVLSPEEESRISYQETQSLSAYDLYLRAREIGYERLDERIRVLRLAIDADPELAAAWGELGMGYGFAVYNRGWDIAWADSALAVAERAIELAPDQPYGYRALSYAYGDLGHARASGQSARKVVELAPSNAFGVRILAVQLWFLGFLPEAVEWDKRGLALHPHDITTRWNLAAKYAQLGLRDRAEQQLELLNVLDPSAGATTRAMLRLIDGDSGAALEFARRHARRAWVPARQYVEASKLAAMAGDYHQALAWVEEAANLSDAEGGALYGGGMRRLPLVLGFSLMRTGNEEEGRRTMEQSLELLGGLIAGGADEPAVMWDLAATYAALNRRTPAIEWAQRAIDAGYNDHPRWVELDPVFESLRGDPEFERIIARIRADQQEMARRVLEQEHDRSP